MTVADSTRIESYFKDNKLQGRCKAMEASGTGYEGIAKDNLIHGEHICVSEAGKPTLEVFLCGEVDFALY